MQFSLFYLPAFHAPVHKDPRTLYAQIVEEAKLGEQIGLHRIWLAEHHFDPYGGDIPHPCILLATIAQCTNRIGLATGGIAVPLHRPIEVAEQLAMVDVLSGGRLTIGVVRAFLAYEYDAYGIDMSESRERFTEGVEIIRGLFSEDSFSFTGNFNRFEEVEIRPKPIQRHPRLTLGAVMTKESFEYAGHNGMDLMLVPYLMPWEVVKQNIDIYKNALTDSGYDPDDFNIMTQFFYYAHSNAEVAKETPRQAMMNYLGYIRNAVAGDRWSKDYVGYEGLVAKVDAITDYDLMYKDRTLYGDTERFHRRVETIAEAGITEIGLMPNMPGTPHEKVMETIEFLGSTLLPVYQ